MAGARMLMPCWRVVRRVGRRSAARERRSTVTSAELLGSLLPASAGRNWKSWLAKADLNGQKARLSGLWCAQDPLQPLVA